MRGRRSDRRRPEDLGWTADDLRSAYASDGSGPFRYAPDGSGPFSYDPDGSGPWLVGREARGATDARVPFAPRSRATRSIRAHVVRSVALGALAVGLVAGSVGIVAGHGLPSTGQHVTAIVHSLESMGD